MMGTTADKLEYLQGTKAAIKQAIVNKGVAVPDGTTFRGYAEKIGDIIDVPDLSNPGAAGDLRSGKQLVGADGSIVTGTLPEVKQATPTISVSSGGLITASATQSGGIVEGGSNSATQQLPTQGAKTVTPTTSEQTVVASGRYTTGDVKVAGDANLVPENIAEGVSIFGVNGTHSGGGPLYSITQDPYNVFYPNQARVGEYVTTVSGEVASNQTLVYDITETYELADPVLVSEYEQLPPQVKEIVDQYSQNSNAVQDAPVTRAPPWGTPGYLYFIMPPQDVVIVTS